MLISTVSLSIDDADALAQVDLGTISIATAWITASADNFERLAAECITAANLIRAQVDAA